MITDEMCRLINTDWN